MATEHILTLLIAERNRLDAAIQALGAGPRKRGRPPKNPLANAPSWATGQPESGGKPKRVVSAAARKRMAAAQRKRWAAVKKAQAK